MMKTNELCVIIPVHKPQMTQYEKISLAACFRHLKNFDCFLIFPAGMDTSEYVQHHPTVLLQPVEAVWLSSVEKYNRMKVEMFFYDMFKDYRYMLTYELDAYIFNADFKNSTFFEFDFIGAPIFEGYMKAEVNARFLGCLNSGFSIRNIQSCRRVLQQIHKTKLQWKFFKFFRSNFKIVRKILVKLKWKKLSAFEHGYWASYVRGKYFHEDIFWSEIIPVLFPFYKIADFKNAYSFSFEVNPAGLFELNDQKLPVGCHAWPKFMDFWKDYIDGAV